MTEKTVGHMIKDKSLAFQERKTLKLVKKILRYLNNEIMQRDYVMYAHDQMEALVDIKKNIIQIYNKDILKDSVLYIHNMNFYKHISSLAKAIQNFYDTSNFDFLQDDVYDHLEEHDTCFKYLLCMIQRLYAQFLTSQFQSFSDYLIQNNTVFIKELENFCAILIVCEVRRYHNNIALVIPLEDYQPRRIVYIALRYILVSEQSPKITLYYNTLSSFTELRKCLYLTILNLGTLDKWWEHEIQEFRHFDEIHEEELKNRFQVMEQMLISCKADDFKMLTQKYANEEEMVPIQEMVLEKK